MTPNGEEPGKAPARGPVRSLGPRVAFGLGLFALYVLLPTALAWFAGPSARERSLDLAGIAVAGALLVEIGVARRLLRSERTYGEVSVAYSIGLVAYLLWIASLSPMAIPFSGGTLSVAYSEIVLLTLAVPILGLGSGLAIVLARRQDRGLSRDLASAPVTPP